VTEGAPSAGDAWAGDGTGWAMSETGSVEASLEAMKDGWTPAAPRRRRVLNSADAIGGLGVVVELGTSGAIESGMSSSLLSDGTPPPCALRSRRRAFSEAVPVRARTARRRATALRKTIFGSRFSCSLTAESVEGLGPGGVEPSAAGSPTADSSAAAMALAVCGSRSSPETMIRAAASRVKMAKRMTRQ
jgi:hypothetical protein